MIGLTLAAFGIVSALFQGGATGWAVKNFGEWNVALFGMVIGVIAVFGYGLATGLSMVLVLLVVHGPEGFVHPMLTAMISKEVPADAQGEMQGGMASIQSLAMLIGTLFFSQMFGFFLLPTSPIVSPDIAFFVAGGFIILALVIFLLKAQKPQRSKELT